MMTSSSWSAQGHGADKVDAKSNEIMTSLSWNAPGGDEVSQTPNRMIYDEILQGQSVMIPHQTKTPKHFIWHHEWYNAVSFK